MYCHITKAFNSSLSKQSCFIKFYSDTKKFCKYHCFVFWFSHTFFFFSCGHDLLMLDSSLVLFPSTNRVPLGLHCHYQFSGLFPTFYLASQYFSPGNRFLTQCLEHACNPHLFPPFLSLKLIFPSFTKIQFSQTLVQIGKRYVRNKCFLSCTLFFIFCLLY